MKERQVHFFLLMNSGFIIENKCFKHNFSQLRLFLVTVAYGKSGADSIRTALLHAEGPTFSHKSFTVTLIANNPNHYESYNHYCFFSWDVALHALFIIFAGRRS
jgi:hypothetical protein